MEDYWMWQGDEEDHLESLACNVLIEARQLRGLLGQAHLDERGKIVAWLRKHTYLHLAHRIENIEKEIGNETATD